MGKSSDLLSIPVVDLGAHADGDPRIGEALATFGFLVLTGHGIPRNCWDEVYTAARRAFALPASVKARYQGPEDGSQRGYLPLQEVRSDGATAPSRKEAWHARREGHRFANIFPSEVPELGPALLALASSLETLADRTLAGVDAFLGKPAGHLAEIVQGSDSLFRVNHYPDRVVDDEAPRFLAHRDFDLITLLLGATKPGLEIQVSDGSWRAVMPSADGIIVNAGDILNVESGGRIPSTAHRVVTPKGTDGGRISMVYFVSPRPDVRLENGVLAGEFIDARLREAGYLR